MLYWCSFLKFYFYCIQNDFCRMSVYCSTMVFSECYIYIRKTYCMAMCLFLCFITIPKGSIIIGIIANCRLHIRVISVSRSSYFESIFFILEMHCHLLICLLGGIHYLVVSNDSIWPISIGLSVCVGTSQSLAALSSPKTFSGIFYHFLLSFHIHDTMSNLYKSQFSVMSINIFCLS